METCFFEGGGGGGGGGGGVGGDVSFARVPSGPTG